MIPNKSSQSTNEVRALIHKCIWGFALLLSAMVLFPSMDQNALVDFGSSWSAARLLCRGENPYDAQSLLALEKSAGWDHREAVIPWNPPWAFSIFIPFSFLPFAYAKWIWILLNGTLILWLADFWWRAYGGPQNLRMGSWLCALWFFPCIVALYFGQMSLMVLAGVTGISWALQKGKFRWLGFFVLFAALKPHLLFPFWLFLFLWLLRQKRWMVFALAGSGLCVACSIVACLRPRVFGDYLSGILSTHGPTLWATPTLGTVLRVAVKEIPGAVVFLPSLAGICLSVMLWKRWGKYYTWERYLDWILLISLATASYAWIFDWAVLLSVPIRLLVWIQANPRRHYVTITGLFLVMAVFVWEQSQGLFPLGAVWFPWGLALVYGLASWQQDQALKSKSAAL